MYYIGVDLHKHWLTVAVESSGGSVGKARSISTRAKDEIVAFAEAHRPFRAVIEASCSYRWLYELLASRGDVVLAHPRQLRAIASGRAKTDKLDARLLAKLLRAELIPAAYVPPKRYAALRDITRARARLSRHMTKAKNEIHALLARANEHSPYANAFCKSGRRWISGLDLGDAANFVRDEALRRIEHYEREITYLDQRLTEYAEAFPEVAALHDIHGIGLYTALLIVAEIGEPWRFRDGRKVGAYAGLTAKVNQSGDHAYYGHITRQGPSALRWILVQVAMKAIRRDRGLATFYVRLRKRSSAKIARVAVARKLAAISWVRLMNWHRAHAPALVAVEMVKT